MAERIKGLQIDLSMRDTGISKTLAGVKREFKSLNSSMKLSGNNFKYGEKTAASYKSRMNDLDGAIKAGTTNLNELEKQYNEVSQAQGSNSAKAVRLQTEYDKQANSINALKDEYGRLDQYYKQNFSSMGQLSNKFKSVGTGMQEVGTKAQTMGQSLTSKITKPALVAGGALAGIALTKGFGRLVEIDTAKAKLSALGNSAKDTNTIMDNAMESVKGTSFGMGEAATTAANAVAAGIKPGKELTKYLTTTGDAAAVAGVDMSEMGRTLNKVQTQNKAYNGELQELSDRGLPIYQWLAKEAGVTGEQVTEMASKGEISSKMLQEAIRNNIGGAAKEMGQKSFTASVQNMWAAVGRLGAAFLDAGGKGGGFFSKLKPIMNNLTETFDKMGPQAEQWGVALGNTFNKVIDGISGIVRWYQGLDGGTQKTLGGLAKWLGIVLFTMGPVLTIFGKFTSVIGGMFSGISGLISFFIKHNAAAKISTASQALWNGVTTTARGIANGYRYAVAALTTSQTAQALKTKASAAAQALWNGVTKIGKGIALVASGAMNGLAKGYQWLAVTQNSTTGKTRIATAATVVWTGVTKAAALATRGLGLAIRFMTGPVGIVITAITALVGGIIYLWKTNSTFRNAVISAWNAIKRAAISVFGFIKPYIINIWNTIKNSSIAVWNTLKKVATTTWNGIKYAIQNPIKALKNVLSTLWNGMKAAAIKIWTLLKNGVVAIIKAYVNQARANFNLVKRIVVTIFNAIKSFAIKVWNAIKNGIINIVKVLKARIINTFNTLKNGVVSIFNAVKNFSLKLWTNIKNGVVSRAKSLWNGVKNMFNNLKNSVNSITSKIRSFLYSVWTAIKNKIISLAKSLWTGVRDKFNALKKSATDITQKLKNAVKDKWEGLKKNVVNLATGAKDGVVKGFKAMYNKGVEWLDKLKGFIKGAKDGFKKVATSLGKGVANGAISGLNAMIDGINTLSDKIMNKKLIKKKIPKLSTGTGANSGVQTDSQGRLKHSTKAVVNDKGIGNAKGPGGHKEIIQRRNGKMIQPKGRNKLVRLRRGDAVHNGMQSKSLIPRLSTGTGMDLLKHGKKHKKHDEVYGDVPIKGGGGGWNPASAIANGSKDAWNWTKDQAKKAKDSFGKAIGDVMEYATNPGKLIGKVMKHFGVDFSGVGGEAMGGTMSWAYDGLKKGLKDLVSGWFTELEGEGDGGYIDLSKGINFPFSPNGRAPGYPFPYPHNGIDINYIYDKLYSVLAGKATARTGYNGGFGNMVDIVSGATKVIYGHMSKHAFSGSKQVKPGDYLGVSGNTGMSSGPHLHFEVQKNGVPIDPLNWLKKNNGGGKAGGKYGSTIKQALGMAGLPQTAQYIKAWQSQAKTESTFNPRAKNPSGASGLVQVKPGTFNQYKLPGHGNIWNPLDNLIAGMRYAKARYGAKGMLSQIGHGLPYATGGLINSSGFYQLAEEGHPEFVIPTDPSRQSDAMKLLAIARQRIEGNKKNKRPNQMRTPSNNDVNNDNTELLLQMIANQQKQLDALMQIARSNKNIEQKPTGVSENDLSRAQGKRAQMMAYNTGGAF